jgi:hypothetical protein
MQLQKISAKQIYFKQDQEKFLSSSCTPFFNNSQSPFLEYEVIINSYKSKEFELYDYFGIISWRFFEKTLMMPETFFSYVIDNPGYEVYFINPFPEQAILYNNVWEQGAISHSLELKNVMNKILKEVGYNFQVEDVNLQPEKILYCNYWFGNPIFWEKYIQFTQPIYNFIQYNKNSELVNFVNKRARYHYNVSFIPFIMERLFSTFLWYDSSIKYKAYIFSEIEIAKLIVKLREDQSKNSNQVSFKEIVKLLVRKYFHKLNL